MNPRDLNDTGLPPDVDARFLALGEAQRGAPEAAMLDACRAIGGGVLSHMLEHVGDLTWRMTATYPRADAGYNAVVKKAGGALLDLRQEGILRRVEAEVASNMAHRVGRGASPERYQAEVLRALRAYADAHRALPAYNDAQAHARDAAVTLGELDFEAAKAHLGELLKRTRSLNAWRRYALDPGRGAGAS